MKMSDVAPLHLLVKTPQVPYYYFLKAGSQLSALQTRVRVRSLLLEPKPNTDKGAGERDGYLLGERGEGCYQQNYTIQ